MSTDNKISKIKETLLDTKLLLSTERNNIYSKIKHYKGELDEIEKIGGIIEKNMGFMDKIRHFLKSEFFKFIKKYLFFVVLFILCFYILDYICNNSKNGMIISETNMFFYMILIFIFIILNDILHVPTKYLYKFTFIIILSMIISYYVMKYINKYDIKHTLFAKSIIIMFVTLFICLCTCIIIYFEYQRNHPNEAFNLFHIFNGAIDKNYFFIIFIFIYSFFYLIIFKLSNWNNNLSNILSPTIMGSMLLFFIFCIFVFIAHKIKLINSNQILNSFIVFLCLCAFVGITNIYIFMDSLNTLCYEVTPTIIDDNNNSTKIIYMIIFAIIIILWLNDSRIWSQNGSIMFIFATMIMIITTVYYSRTYPSTSIPSLWLLIEWINLIFKQYNNSKNSFHNIVSNNLD